ncbi:tyrosine-protein kinase involved in EPS biosynthesis [Dyella mobilis]|nr:tyrosine-protein kinase involved in EPS biosynthesis [Dyella mobilis]
MARESSCDAIDIIALLDVLWRSWRLIAKVAALIFIAGVLYAWLATPTYESSLLVQIESSSDNAGTELLGSLSTFLGVKSSDDAEMQILGSNKVIGAAVDETRYDIEAEPARFPLIGQWIARGSNSPSKPGMFGVGGYAWGNESLDIVQFDTPSLLYDDTFTLMSLGAGRYSLHSSDLPNEYVGRVGEPAHIPTRYGEIALNIEGMNANVGTRFKLYRHSRQLTVADLRRRIAIVDKSKDAGIISVALKSVHPQRATELLQAIGRAYVRQNGERKAQEAEKSLAFLEHQLPGMKKDLQSAEDALLAYRNAHGAVDLSEEARQEMGQVVALQTRISLLQQERQAKLEQFTARHPSIVSVDAQIALLDRQMRGIEQRIKRLPATEQDVVRLTREVRVNNDLYVAMLNSMQQLRLLRAGKVGNVRIIDDAELPEQPVTPRRALIMIGALALGLLAGIVIALLRSLWRGSVTEPHEIEQLLDVPVQATIPLSKRQLRNDRRGLRRLRMPLRDGRPVAISQPQEPAVEGLRGLSVAVQLLGLDARKAVVLITSATQGVGKSFVASNLAVLLAKAGKQVLLIDGDLRKGTLHHTFQLAETKGLSSILRREATLAEAVQKTVLPGLSLLASGSKTSDPTELLQSPMLETCLAEAATSYDVVLVDTAPLLPVADTLWLALHASTVYVVARYGITSEGELIETRARLTRADIEFEGIVLNGVQTSLQGARYGQYGYGSYLSEAATQTVESKGGCP